MSVNVKDKDCDFFKLYIYLVLAENFLSFHHLGEEKSVAIDTWCKFLRNCSSQITSTDWRSYASKVCAWSVGDTIMHRRSYTYITDLQPIMSLSGSE